PVWNQPFCVGSSLAYAGIRWHYWSRILMFSDGLDTRCMLYAGEVIMYTCTLTILVFSTDLMLESVLSSIVPAEQFSHTVQRFSTFSQKLAATGDIVIIDTPTELSLFELRSCCKKDAVLVFCTERAQEALLHSTDYQQLDDVWFKPYTKDFIAFRCKAIFSLLKIKKDRDLFQNYLDTTIDSLPDMIWFKDLQGRHLKVNNGFCKAVGKEKKDIQGRDHYFIWDIDREEYTKGEYICLDTDQAVLAARKTCLFTEHVKSKDGMRQLRTYKSPLFDETGTIMGTVGIAHDVTDLGNMDAELDLLVRSLPFAILVKDEHERIVKVNAKFEEYFHIAAKDIVGKTYPLWRDCILSKTGSVRSLERNNDGHREIVLCINATSRIIEIHEEQIVDIFHTVIGQINMFRDITIERTLKQKIIHSSNTDFLTGLYNRRYFYAFMEENRGHKSIALLYLDIDNFKIINDCYGHDVGDSVLVTIARLLKETFLENLISRIGGDEFLVAIMNADDMDRVCLKAQLFLKRVQQAFGGNEQLKMLSVSIGIAETNGLAMSIDELIRCADRALYESKRNGKARYSVYSPESAD
ncbi:MAG: diguanylate cyclase, partial [Bilophila sp.]